MGVPQTRHRVFFIAVRNDIDFDMDRIDMAFNYEPITYGEIKSGRGIHIDENTQQYKMLSLAKPGDKNISDVLKRECGKTSCFCDMIVWDDDVCCTITSKANIMSPVSKTRISIMDVIHCQTFPENYNFVNHSYIYICGMSVPPIMIKRIVTRLIESGLFNYKGVK